MELPFWAFSAGFDFGFLCDIFAVFLLILIFVQIKIANLLFFFLRLSSLDANSGGRIGPVLADVKSVVEPE